MWIIQMKKIFFGAHEEEPEIRFGGGLPASYYPKLAQHEESAWKIYLLLKAKAVYLIMKH